MTTGLLNTLARAINRYQSIDASGNLVYNNTVGIQAGTATAPGLFFAGDADTGVYSTAGNSIAVATGGTQRAYVDSSGLTVVNASTGITVSGGRMVSHQVNAGGSVIAVSLFNNSSNAGTEVVIDLQPCTSNPAATRSAQVVAVNNGSNLIDLIFRMSNGDVPVERARITGVGQFQIVSGSASIPTVSFAGDTTTGLYRVSAGNLAISNNGVMRYSFGSTAFGITFATGVTPASYDAGQVFTTVNSSQSGDTREVMFGTSPSGNGYIRTIRTMEFVTVGTLVGRFTTSGDFQVNTTTTTERMTVNGAARFCGASYNFSAGLEGTIVDFTGTVARVGHVNGLSGSIRQTEILQAGVASLTFDTNRNVLFSGNIVNGLKYLDIRNTDNGTSGVIIRLITNDAANSVTTSLDIVKYRTGGVLYANNEANGTHMWSIGGTTRMQLDTNGLAVTGTLGYGVGAGGAVTQATSKTTAVTLNKASGAITMNGAALAAATTVQFTVNCNVFGANDTVVICLKGGVSAFTNYTVSANAQGAGQFVVKLTNETAGSLSESVILQYAIIKGQVS